MIKLAVTAMFKNHFYALNGKMIKQKEGGPIGLRGTCAVARLIMQMFDVKWESRLTDLRIIVWLVSRYMDDGRAFLPPIRPGWRINEGRLQFSLRWKDEDETLSPTEITRRVIAGSLRGVEKFLKFTTETCEDFETGWLPTLDTSLQVGENNLVKFKFYEKPVGPGRTVQQRTAMPENNKIQVLSNEMVRRLLNTEGDLPKEEYTKIVDDYAQKLSNSGYSITQIRRIIVSGIRGYGGKVNRSKELGMELRRTAHRSQGARSIKKLTGKTTWFRKGKDKRNWYDGGEQKQRTGGAKVWREQGCPPASKSPPEGRGTDMGGQVLPPPPSEMSWRKGEENKAEMPSTVIFVEQTNQGALASKLRELTSRLEPIVGFKIKIVERCGNTLGSKFSQDTLWQGSKCGRGDCVTCEQGAEVLPPCTAPSVIYENFCASCNPGAGAKGEVKDVSMDPPSVYVGESSRSIKERSKEHWSGYVKKSEENHMHKHHQLHHGGEQPPPKFIMKVVTFPRSALARQVGEAIRIRKRGGEGGVLNSKAEYNRSYIPRLQIENKADEEAREQDNERVDSMIKEALARNHGDWVEERTNARKGELGRTKKTDPTKRTSIMEDDWENKNPRRRKKLKYMVVAEGWGSDMGGQVPPPPPPTPPEGQAHDPDQPHPPPLAQRARSRRQEVQKSIKDFLRTTEASPGVENRAVISKEGTNIIPSRNVSGLNSSTVTTPPQENDPPSVMRITKEKVGRQDSEEEMNEKLTRMDNKEEFSPKSTEQTVLPSMNQDLNTDDRRGNGSLFLMAPLRDDAEYSPDQPVEGHAHCDIKTPPMCHKLVHTPCYNDLNDHAQGLPPVPSGHVGSMGEVTKGWGSNLTIPPPTEAEMILESSNGEMLTEKMKSPSENIADTAPSVAENLNKDGELETQTPCTFKRGVCTEHNLRGEKVITKKRSWVRKKTGLAGWSTTRTVTYLCRFGMRAESAGIVDITNDVPMPNRSPALEHSRTFVGISEHGD